MIYIFLFFTALIYFFFLIKNSGEESRIKVQNKFIIITSLSLSFLFMIYFFNNSFIQDRDEIQRISQKHEKLRNDIVKIKSNIPSLIEKLERMPDYYVGWVMLARSYQLTGDKISASIAFDKALKIRDDEIDIIQEYIYLLKDLDPKRNKNKITKLFDKIITSNSNNINTYNMLLNYSVEINDIELTRNTLEKIINETDIENKKPYIDALNQISSQSNFGFTVRLSSNWIKSYNQMKHIEKARTYENKGFQWTRRIIALTAVFMVIAYPKLVPVFFDIPVILTWTEFKGGFLFLIDQKEVLMDKAFAGVIITPLDTHLMSAIVGLYFGGSLVKK